MERRQTSGLTSRLILNYVERSRGRRAVADMLRRAGLEDREERFRDENYWFDFGTKIRLFEAAAEELDDPDVALHIGAAALELNVASGVKLALRAFGSPRLVYANIVSASGKFTWAHTWEVIELGPGHAQLRYADVSGVGYHALDCQYNRGLLSCIPEMFGSAAARIDHRLCALDGSDACVYEITWEARGNRKRPAVALALATAGTVGPAAIAAPGLLPAAIALPAAGAALLSYLEHSRLRRICRSLKTEVTEQRDASDRLSGSLRDLMSDLRTDEVLDKITANAKAAVGGKEFVLLVSERKGVCRSRGSNLAPNRLLALEQWAARTPAVFEAPMTIDDLGAAPGLVPLALDPSMPLGSLCAAPLIFKGERLGALVALAYGPRAFLPRDTTLLQSYAAQAAAALSNARLVGRLETLARQDPLTELLNHREFHETIEREIGRCERGDDVFSVILLDLDGFKRVNDNAGHAEGDQLLREVASAIRQESRAGDVACRIGGDEFGLVLPRSGADDATSIMERLESALGSLDAPVRASFGIAAWPQDGPTKDLLLLRADMALFALKSARGDRRAPEPSLNGAGPAVSSEGVAARLVFQRLTRQACQMLGADKAAIFLRDSADPQRIVGAGGHGIPHELLASRHISEGITGKVVRTGEPIVIDDYRMALDRLDSHAVSDLRAAVSVPLRWGGTVRGVLAVATTDPSRRFSESDVRLLSEFADVGIVALENAEMRERLDESLHAGVEAMALAVDLRDSYTAAHSERVVLLARAVAQRFRLEPAAVMEVEYGARLHDLGKIGIPDSILQKQGKLSASDWNVVRQHSVWGEEILKRIPGLARVASIVRSEHERWDGRGYPDGLVEEEIPLASRIIAACDAYHAMTSDRPYRSALDPQAALRELASQAGTQFDPAVVDALIDVLEPASTDARVSFA